jgi:hypothetical protein
MAPFSRIKPVHTLLLAPLGPDLSFMLEHSFELVAAGIELIMTKIQVTMQS